MSLRSLVPALPDDVHDALDAAGISNVQDIMFAQIGQLYSRLPPGLITLEALSGLKVHIAQLTAAPATRGDDLLSREEAHKNAGEPCMCGVDELDALLGGFGHHSVIEIAGGKGCGKTGLVMQVVLRHLANHPEHTVLWLDIGGEFSVERAADILQLNSGIGATSALERLSVTFCFDVAEARQVLDDLRISLAAETDARRTRFIVIDPITPLFAPILNAVSSQGTPEAAHAPEVILFHKKVTHRLRPRSYDNIHALPFLLSAHVTNTAVQAGGRNPFSAFEDTTTKPALGPSFTFLTDETLWLARMETGARSAGEDAHVFVAEVFRSHSKLSNTWCAFVIKRGVYFEPFAK